MRRFDGPVPPFGSCITVSFCCNSTMNARAKPNQKNHRDISDCGTQKVKALE